MSLTTIRRVVLDRFGEVGIVLEADEVIVHCLVFYDKPDTLLLVIQRSATDAKEETPQG